VEQALASCELFWNETPKPGPDTPALVMKYGVDPAAPLDSWLSPPDQARVAALGAVLGVQAPSLAAARPWLAVQMLQGAANASRGLKPEHSPDGLLTARAAELGIPIRSEFPTTGDNLAAFASLPRDAEVQFLLWTLDSIEAGPAAADARQRRWAIGDLSLEEADAPAVQSRYPDFYAHLVIARNHGWVPRIQQLVETRTPALVLVGAGHMVGPESIPELLAAQGLPLERV
jgi:uncharacterized protein YbaP (TraB family)